MVAYASPAEAQAAPRWYEFSPGESTVYVVTHRGGLLSFLGHEHAILVRDLAGGVCRTETPAGAWGYVSADARTLEIYTDLARQLAQLEGKPSAGQLRAIREKFQDAAHLASEEYPRIVLDSLVVRDGAGPRWIADGVLTIRGQTRPVEIAFDVPAWDSARLRLHGMLAVKQSDFGIRPESIAGVVRVKDVVHIHFDLAATQAVGSCPARGDADVASRR